MANIANLGSPGGPEPPRTLLFTWQQVIPIFLFGGLALAALLIFVGPTGKVKEAIDNVKPQSKSKLENQGMWNKAQEKIIAAKPAGKRWTDLTEEDISAIVDRVHVEGLTRDDIRKKANEIQREKRTDEQVLPSDDPKERWKQLTGNKFENRRQIDLKDETGALNCPQIDVFEDEGKTRPAGQMNHDEWIVILENKGAMAKVQRLKDKKEAWIEAKVLKQIYTKEDIAKGPSAPKPKDKDEGDRKSSGKDEWGD